MDAVIEVTAAEAVANMTVTKVKTQKVDFPEVPALVSVVVTSILRSLRQGKTALNAVAPDFTLQGGMAVA